MLQTLGHRVTTAMLGQWQLRFAPADITRIHDLVGFPMLQNPILMNPGAVGESVFTHDCLAPSDNQTAHPADQARCFHDLTRVQISVECSEVVRTRPYRHYD